MSFKLDWTLFRRLIQLELLLMVLTIPAVMLELWRFSKVDEGFDGVLAALGYAEAPAAIMLPFSLIVLVAYLASLFGMLRRRRWARTLYVAGFLAWPLGWLVLGPVSWSGPATDLIEGVSYLVGGAILLLAFSGDHGTLWFTSPEDQS